MTRMVAFLLGGAAVAAFLFWLGLSVWLQNRTVGEALTTAIIMALVVGSVAALEGQRLNVLRLVVVAALALVIALAHMPWWAYGLCLVLVLLASSFAPRWFQRPPPPGRPRS